ncbi:MAG: hypothetical protein R2756_12155 [Bacteroidales bacterium]
MSRTSLVLVILILVSLSCEDGYLTNCEECYASSDYSVVLEIRYRNPDLIPSNPVVTLYEGNVSDNIILEKYYINEPVSYIRYYAILQGLFSHAGTHVQWPKIHNHSGSLPQGKV